MPERTTVWRVAKTVAALAVVVVALAAFILAGVVVFVELVDLAVPDTRYAVTVACPEDGQWPVGTENLSLTIVNETAGPFDDPVHEQVDASAVCPGGRILHIAERGGVSG